MGALEHSLGIAAVPHGRIKLQAADGVRAVAEAPGKPHGGGLWAGREPAAAEQAAPARWWIAPARLPASPTAKVPRP